MSGPKFYAENGESRSGPAPSPKGIKSKGKQPASGFW